MLAHSQIVSGATSLIVLVAAILAGSPALAAEVPQDPQFVIHTPDTTGMPGQGAVMFARVAPDGNVWVSSNTAGDIWLFGGIGILDPMTDLWTTHSSRNTPLQFWNYQVQWDAAGRAWIACENQLVMLDGDEWTVFDPANSPLVGDRNWDVAVDQATDHIWIANADIDQVQGGLFEYDPAGNSWTHHDEPFMRTYFGISAPIAVYARSNGEIWATFNFMGGNARRVGGTWLHQTGPQILEFAEASNGTLYGVAGTGTYRYNDATSAWTKILNYNSNVIAINDQDHVFVGVGTNVYRLTNSAWTNFIQGPSDVKSVGFDAAGDIWVAYKHSVRRYDSAGNGKRIYSSVMTGIGEYIINNIERDNDGNIWTMAGVTGATRFDGQRYRNFSQYGHEETNPFQYGGTLLCTNVKDVFQDSQGNVWLAATGAARSADLENWDHWYWANSNLPFDQINAIGEDVNGDIWAGSNGSGIYRFDGNNWHYRSLGPNYDSNRVREIVSTPDGAMWVATYTGVHRFDGQEWSFFNSNSAFIPGLPIDLAVGPDGHLWVANSGGLSRYNGSTWFVYGPWNAPFMHAKISSVAVRSDGLVAACSEDVFNWPYSGDLVFFDGEQWSQFPGGYGNPNPFYQAHAMEFDRDGHLWVAQVNYGAVQVMVGPQLKTGDLNGDNVVDVSDLLILLAAWGPCPRNNNCPADLNGDSAVDVSDLLTLLANWG